MAQLEMASFTVVLKNGIRYGANNLQVHLGGANGWESFLSFICSGRLTTKRADEVDHIEWRETGRQHCDMCDERLTSHAVLAAAQQGEGEGR